MKTGECDINQIFEIPTKVVRMLTDSQSPQLSIVDCDQITDYFKTGALPRNLWNHRAHLIVAFTFLTDMTKAESLVKMSEGIQNYNRIHGIQATPSGGYHHTLTCFWVEATSAAMEHGKDLAFNLQFPFIEQRCPKDLPMRFFSKAHLFSQRARFEWLEPDLQPLSF